jgi:glycerol-3-phosphate acyltransferase PlsY
VLPAAGLSLALGYALGSIPWGLLLTRLGGAGDLRSVGSGNIGATNVLRTGRKGLAAATLALDAAKGAAAVLIAEALWPGLAAFAATGAFFGHLYPVWLRFAGGKGVATLLGVVLALLWPAGLVYAALWLGRWRRRGTRRRPGSWRRCRRRSARLCSAVSIWRCCSWVSL